MGNDREGIAASSIGRKQILAVAGLVWIKYLIMHLAGNFLIFGGPELLNGYSEKLHAMLPLLWFARVILIIALLIHIYFAIILTFENWRARSVPYAVKAAKGDNSWAARTMIYTGLIVVVFLWLHLTDFTIADKAGEASFVETSQGRISLGLYGLVWNAFLRPWHVFIYFLTLVVVGLHVSHGVQSFFQTFGLFDERYTPAIRKLSVIFGAVIAVGFATIPIYVIIRHFTVGVGV
ncbi:MAG: succinate dehydrogenase cytochrome b subunit [Candidatus Hydrogenedentes bacterium]|nr:succinate dehydrogenase cytochrome b subunit [Candidatus Hydrogenedentota bacterium]